MIYAAPLKFDEIDFLLRIPPSTFHLSRIPIRPTGLLSSQYFSMGPLAVVLDFPVSDVSNSLD